MTHQTQRRLGTHRERGAVLVFVAVALIGLLAFSALAIDMGVMVVGRRQVQNAADAGALAGAVSLAYVQRPSDWTDFSDPAYTRAKQTAAAVAKANLAWGQAPRVDENVDVQIIDCPEPIPNLPDKCLRVNAYRNQEGGTGNVPLPTFFARLVGVDEQGARATATAQLWVGNSVRCVKPWAIPDLWYDYHDEHAPVPSPPDDVVTAEDRFELYEWQNQLRQDPSRPLANPDVYVPRTVGDPNSGSGYRAPRDLGRFIVLKTGNPAGSIQPGWFYPITLPEATSPSGQSTGGADYRWNIANCNPTEVIQGQDQGWPVEPGNMIGPTSQGIRDLVAQDPNAELQCANSTCWVENSVCASQFCEGPSPRWVPVPVFNPEVYLTNFHQGRFVFQVEEFIGIFVDGLVRDLDATTRAALQSDPLYQGVTLDGDDVVGRFVPIAAARGTRNGTSTFLRTVVLVR